MSYRCPECPVTGSKSNVRAHQLLEAHFGEPMPTKKPTDLQVLAARRYYWKAKGGDAK